MDVIDDFVKRIFSKETGSSIDVLHNLVGRKEQEALFLSKLRLGSTYGK